jgi:hypothetical protein
VHLWAMSFEITDFRFFAQVPVTLITNLAFLRLQIN